MNERKKRRMRREILGNSHEKAIMMIDRAREVQEMWRAIE